jgi:hypothetical protein
MKTIKERRRKRSLPLPWLARAWMASVCLRAMVDERATCSRSTERTGEGE